MENNEILQNECNYSEFKEIILKHFLEINRMLKLLKDKDNSLYILNKELENYRFGYVNYLFKSIALQLISYLEDCRKALRDIEKYELEEKTVKKYVNYLVSDFDELLLNLGIDENNGEYLYNGKKLFFNEERVFESYFNNEVIKENKNIEIEEELNFENKEDILKYIAVLENRLIDSIKEHKQLDENILNYTKQSFAIEAGFKEATVYPVLRKVISIYKDLKNKENKFLENIDEENFIEIYKEILVNLIDSLIDALYLANVQIDGEITSEYNPRKHRVIKQILSEDSNNANKICNVYTNTYLIGEKVIYPGKVDIYKIK